MRRLTFSFLLLFAGLFCLAQVPHSVVKADGLSAPIAAPQIGLSGPGVRFPPISAGGGCTAATNALARLDGSENIAALTAFICGGVTDGWWGTLDFFYMYMINSSANALTNLVSSSFAQTANNSPTFTANQGYTGNAFNAYLSSTYVPSTSGTHYTQNSAHLGFCILTSRNTAQPYIEGGASDVSNQVFLEPYAFTSLTSYGVNDNNFNAPSVATNTQGVWIETRVSSTEVLLYQNGGTALIDNTSSNSSGLPTVAAYALADNVSGTANSYTGDQLGAFFAGGALTQTLAGNLTSRLHTYAVAVGASGC